MSATTYETGSEPLDLYPAIEAVLFVAEQPLDHLRLAQAVGHPPEAVAEALTELVSQYEDAHHGFELRKVAGGWRFFTRAEFFPAVERFARDDKQARMSQAALETLAIVAYQQPVSRSRISSIRGVSVDAVVRTLVTRELIEEVAHDESTGAALYGTSQYFLERMGLNDIGELPELAPLLPAMDELNFDDSHHVAANSSSSGAGRQNG